MLCEKCGQAPATVEQSDVVHKKVIRRHLCESCFESSGLSSPMAAELVASGINTCKPADFVNIKDFLAEVLASLRDDTQRGCDQCGMTLAEFRGHGRIGCARDYDVFAEELNPLLFKLHGAQTHIGRTPKSVETLLAREHQIALLQKELQAAVNNEKFEDAARLRDRIRALEKSRERTP